VIVKSRLKCIQYRPALVDGIPAQIRTLARVRHRAEGELAFLEGHLDPGDPRRPAGSQGGNRLVSVPVEEPPHALRELRLRALDVIPRRHAPNISQARRPSISIRTGLSACKKQIT